MSISVTGTLIQTGVLRCFLSKLGFPAIISPFEWQVLLARSHFAKWLILVLTCLSLGLLFMLIVRAHLVLPTTARIKPPQVSR